MTDEKKKYQHDYYMTHKDKYKEYVKNHKEKIEVEKRKLETTILLDKLEIKLLKSIIKDLKTIINILSIMVIAFAIYMSFVGVNHIMNGKTPLGCFLLIIWFINMILITRLIIINNKEDE